MSPIIDREGRVCGRWHVLDMAVGVVVLAVAWTGYAVAQVSAGRWRQAPMRQETVPIELLVTFAGIDGATARQIHVGDVEVDGGGHELARILEVRPPEPETLTVRFGDQDWVKQVPNPTSGRLDVRARLRVLGDLRGDVIYYKGRLLGAGAQLGFQTDHYAIRGMVYEQGWVRIEALSEWLPYSTIQRLKEGVREEQDLDGEPIARILKIAEIRTVNSGGDTLAVHEPPSFPPPPLSPSQNTPPKRPQKREWFRHWRKPRPVPQVQEAKSSESVPTTTTDLSAQRWYVVTFWADLRCNFNNGILVYKGHRAQNGKEIFLDFGQGAHMTVRVSNISSFKTASLTVEVVPSGPSGRPRVF